MSKPEQRISASGRTPQWYKENGNFYSERCKWNSNARQKMYELLDLARGRNREIDFKYVMNPSNDPKKKNYPAKMKNHPIILPILRQLQGEKIGRNFEPTVIAVNSDVNNTRQNFIRDSVLHATHQVFLNALIQQGLFVEGQTDQNGKPVQEPQHPDEIRKQAQNIPDTLSIMGQRAIEYIKRDQKIEASLRDCWHHFVSTTMFVTYRGIRNDNVEYYTCNPLNFDYFGNSTEKYIDKMEAQRYITDVTYSDLVDLFAELDEPEAKNMLSELRSDETGNRHTRNFFDIYNENRYGMSPSMRNSVVDRTNPTFTLEHIQWTGLAKYTILELDGEKIYLDEDYKPLPGEKTQTVWLSQKYEVYRVADKYVLGGRAIEENRGTMDKPGSCRSNYGGYIMHFSDGMLQQGIVEQLEAYQHSYNASKWKLQSLINKYQGKKTIIGKGMLTDDSDPEWTWDKKLDLADAMGYLLIDENAANVTAIVQAIKDINPNDATQLQLIMDHCQNIKDEAGELVGFNRFRKGNTQASDGVGNAQQGEYVGSLITEIYFKCFADAEENEYDAILDLSKNAWRNGKKATYMRSDSEIQLLEVEGADIARYRSAEFGCFVTGSGEAKRNLEILKNQAQAFVQNGLGASNLAKMLRPGRTFASIEEDLENAERDAQQREQSKQQQENQIAQQQLQQTERHHQEDLALGYHKVDAPLEVKLQEIVAGANDGTEHSLEYDKLVFEVQKALQESQAKRAELQADIFKTKIKASTDVYKADQSLKVARTNPG